MALNFRDRSFAFSGYLSLLVAWLLIIQPLAMFASDADLDPSVPAADRRAVHVLSRITFGARPADLERIKTIGISAYVDQQLSPETLDDSALQKRLDKLATLNLSNPTIAQLYNPPKPVASPSPAMQATAVTGILPQPTAAADPSASPTPTPKPTPPPKNPGMVVSELQRAKLLRAVYSERQFYEVIVDFWENHFSIFANKDADRLLLTSFDRDSIRPFALGRFRDLLGATAHSPAMMFYLDNWQSRVVRNYPATKDKPARTVGGINENYARELMELHTLGVGGGYTQKDVEEVARCFTGWTIHKPNEEGIFYFDPAQHDNGEKTVLGQKIAAGGGIADGERVLDILAKSPATAKFVVTKLARRFVGDDPPTTLIARASAVFLKTDGSIAETLRAIVTSPEFYSQTAFRSKVKSPFEFVASALRATGADTDAGPPMLGWIARMGQPVYGRVTPDGYPDMSTSWLSNNDLLTRFNFAVALMGNGIRGTKVDTSKLLPPASNGDDTVNAVIGRFLLVKPSNESRAALEKIVSDMQFSAESKTPISAPAAGNSMLVTTPIRSSPNRDSLDRQLIALVLGSPEFQRK